MGDVEVGLKTDREILREFIEAYRELTELWDVGCKDYANKDKRNAAYDQLLLIFKRLKSEATVDDVKKKINTLRSNFRKELRKIQDALQNGNSDGYQHTSWLFQQLIFLQHSEPIKTRHDLSDRIAIMPKEKSAFSVLVRKWTSEFEGYSTDGKIIFCQFCQKQVQCHKRFQLQQHDRSETHQGNKRRRMKDRQQTLYNQQQMLMDHSGSIDDQIVIEQPSPERAAKPVAKTTKFAVNSSQSKDFLSLACDYLSKQDEDLDIAKVWARKLKTLAADQKLFAEKAINDVLFEAQLGTLHRNSVTVNEPYSTGASTPLSSPHNWTESASSFHPVIEIQTSTESTLHEHLANSSVEDHK